MSDIEAIEEWLVDQGLTGKSEASLVEGFALRLRQIGIPADRLMLGSDLLHPTLGGHGFRWTEAEGVVAREYDRDVFAVETNPDWATSPFRHMLENGLEEFRRRLDDTHVPGEFTVIDDIKQDGGTDYVAFGVSFGPEPVFSPSVGLLVSVATQREGGFSERDIALMRRLTRRMGLAYKVINGMATSRTLLRTYLGDDAADHVLSGSIGRGVAEMIRAAIWYSDLEGFTRLADTLPHERLVPFLNAYAECFVTAIHQHGGQVLKFIGDGLLAIFPLDGRAATSPAAAIEAAVDAQRRLHDLVRERQSAGEPVTRCYIGLHLGDVLYGNIGSAARLDFTVLGPAVNETSRIERMCRSLEQPIIISQTLAQSLDAQGPQLVSLGRYMLRGVARPQELFTLNPDLL